MKRGGPLNFLRFRLIRFDSAVNKPYKLNLIRRTPGKFSGPPPALRRVHLNETAFRLKALYNCFDPGNCV